MFAGSELASPLTLRDIPSFPPPWAYASVRGDPQALRERRGRLAAQRGLVALRLSFSRAAAEVGGATGQQLQRLVREAADALELWLLQPLLMDALPPDCPRAEQHDLAMAQDLAALLPSRQLPVRGALAQRAPK